MKARIFALNYFLRSQDRCAIEKVKELLLGYLKSSWAGYSGYLHLPEGSKILNYGFTTDGHTKKTTPKMCLRVEVKHKTGTKLHVVLSLRNFKRWCKKQEEFV